MEAVTKRNEIGTKNLTPQELKGIKVAKGYLHYESKEDLVTMIKAIINHKVENELIDNVKGVKVWEGVKLEFTVKQFCEFLEYFGKEFND